MVRPGAHRSDALPPAQPGAPDADTADPARITSLLHAMASGAPEAQHDLLPLVYEHLRWVARAQLAHEPVECSVEATSLVHEAYLRILGESGLGSGATVDWVDRQHFFNTAARAMRFVLVDRARAMLAGRRRDAGGAVGGPRRPVALPQDVIEQATRHPPESIEEVEVALREFERLDSRAAQVVVWRVYNGMTIEAVAQHLGCGVQTVNRDWRRARAWLADRLAHEPFADETGERPA